MQAALEQGRAVLESLAYPDNLDHHFVVDPAKFDFYAMDCYRVAGEDQLAQTYAREVIRAGTGADGVERKPMRVSDARITLAVVAAREGELSEAVEQGRRALAAERKSLPSLAFASQELSTLLVDRYGKEPAAAEYLGLLRSATLPPAIRLPHHPATP